MSIIRHRERGAETKQRAVARHGVVATDGYLDCKHARSWLFDGARLPDPFVGHCTPFGSIRGNLIRSANSKLIPKTPGKPLAVIVSMANLLGVHLFPDELLEAQRRAPTAPVASSAATLFNRLLLKPTLALG